MQACSEQWNSIDDRLFIGMNFPDSFNHIINMTDGAGNFDLEFRFFTDLAKFAAVWVSAVERPPTADYMTVRQARIVIADMSSIEVAQSFLKDAQVRFRNEYFQLAIVHDFLGVGGRACSEQSELHITVIESKSALAE